jgi:N-methylhydantoinase B
MGGWGATAARDGVNAQFSSSHGDTFNCPVEIAGFPSTQKRT